MIQKLRKQFILIAMLSTFAVLFVILGTLNVANYISMNVSADKLLSLISENDGTFPEFFMGRVVDFDDDLMEGKFGGFTDDEDTWPDLPDDADEFRGLPKDDEFRPGKGDGMEPPEMPSEKDMRQFRKNFSNETPYETRFFSVKYSPQDGDEYTTYTGRIASVTEDEAVSYAKSVLAKFQSFKINKGYAGNYRYRISSDENGGSLVVFLDMTKEKKNFETVLKYSLILSAVGLFAVFMLVRHFSKIVFKPVEESDRKQKQFITDASHELKTPLTIISANVEVMEMESEESDWSKSIKHQVKRMTGMVEQMVTLSRLDESNELSMTDFSLSDAVSDTAEAYIAVAEKNGQELVLNIEEGIRFHGDEGKIRQMVGLLLDNAAKYAESPEGKNSVIKLSLQKKGKKNQIIVWNTLKETQPGNKNQLFERFYRPDESRNSKKGGSGIGLAIVKSIAEAHKGKVSAFSADTKSIEFEVLI